MKSKVITCVFLAILITFIFAGCQSELTEEEYLEVISNFGEVHLEISDQILERAQTSYINAENLEIDQEIENGINELDNIVTEARNRIPREKENIFNNFIEFVNTLKETETHIQNGTLDEDGLINLAQETINIVTLGVVEEGELSEDEFLELTQVSNFDKRIESYKEEFNVQLEWKDVQFNMENNVDNEFIVAGTAELSDYYNYGFSSDIEKNYFCARVTPPNSTYSDRWYLYFHRDSFDNLFQELRKGEVQVITTSEIPSYRFKRNQGNMAQVKQVRW